VVCALAVTYRAMQKAAMMKQASSSVQIAIAVIIKLSLLPAVNHLTTHTHIIKQHQSNTHIHHIIIVHTSTTKTVSQLYLITGHSGA